MNTVTRNRNATSSPAVRSATSTPAATTTAVTEAAKSSALENITAPRAPARNSLVRCASTAWATRSRERSSAPNARMVASPTMTSLRAERVSATRSRTLSQARASTRWARTRSRV